MVEAFAEQHDNIPLSRRTETTSAGDTATCDEKDTSGNVRDGAAATLSTAVYGTSTTNLLASNCGHLSEVVAGVERDSEPLGTTMLLTRSQSAERELRSAEERQIQQGE